MARHDKEWTRGLPKKKGVPMGLPTAAQAFWAKERARAMRKKQAAALAQTAKQRPASRPAAASPPKPTPAQIAGSNIAAVQKEMAIVAENNRRLEEMAAPVLEREGLSLDDFIPGSLTTKLVLSGRDGDARIVTQLIAGWNEMERLRGRERKFRGDYARAKADESAKPKPPWL